MAVYFFDSSALVKRYLQETGSSWVIGIIDSIPPHEIFVSRLTSVEIVSAIVRKARGGGLSHVQAAAAIAAFRADWLNDYVVVEVTESLASQATQLAETHALRSADAVQLATALAVQDKISGLGLSPLTMISSDAELNVVAQTERLSVDDPNAHP